jgi:YegS/Rv2252/BmrU family lipid kinase
MSKKNKFIRVKLIVNPGAGNAADAATNLELVTGFLKNNGLKADVTQARPKVKATPLARKAIKDGYKIVIAMGGDGTIEAVMRGMVGSKVRLGIIPIGIENNIAKSLGIPVNLEDACVLIASRKTRKLDVGEVKAGKGKSFPFFEMAGVGLSSAMYPVVAKKVADEQPGLQDAVSELTQKETRPKVILTLDDKEKIEVDALLVMVSNTSVFGKKFLLTPNASLKDGFLDISVYQDFSKTELSKYYTSMMDGGYSGDGKVLRYQARKLKVRTLPRLKVTADGIEQGKGTVTIKMRSGALRVIAAKKSQEVEIPPIDEVIPVPARDEVIPVPARDEVENLPESDTVRKDSAPGEEV